MKRGEWMNTTVETKSNKELLAVGALFLELLEKYNRLDSKRFFYRDLLEELTMIEINTIVVIGRNGNRQKMSDVANSLGVSTGTPTVTVDRLIKKGYVLRDKDPEDRRQVIVMLSEKGLEAYRHVVELKGLIVERLFSLMTDEQLKALISILDVLNTNFDDLFDSPLK